MSTFEESQGHSISSAGARRLQERLKNDQPFFHPGSGPALARSVPSHSLPRHLHSLYHTTNTLSRSLSLSLSLSLLHTHTHVMPQPCFRVEGLSLRVGIKGIRLARAPSSRPLANNFQAYLTESVLKIVLQKSIPAQIRQLFLSYY